MTKTPNYIVLFAALLTSCGRWTPAAMAPAETSGCRSDVIRWFVPDEPDERIRLDSWCAGVGQPVMLAQPSVGEIPRQIEAITFVSWNVHAGNGDIRRFVADLARGTHTRGRSANHYVLMLQEAVRTEGVPAFAGGMAGAGRITARAIHPSHDIVQIARELGLSLVYVPSMRNGNSARDPNEDRGSAILSTLPLSDAAAIELPGERQRRVAILAGAGPVTVGTVHLDATGRWNRRLRLFWTPWLRDAQIRSMQALLPQGPLVIGADLNSWHGFDERGVRTLTRMVADTPVSADRRGLGLRVLDYLFFRAGPDRRAYYRELDNRYGSDHRPLVGWIE